MKSKKKRSKNKKQSWAQTIEEEDIAKEMDRCNLKSDEPPSGDEQKEKHPKKKTYNTRTQSFSLTPKPEVFTRRKMSK